MLRAAGGGGLLALLHRRRPSPAFRRRVCACNMSGKTSPTCPKFVALPNGGGATLGSGSAGVRFRIVSYNILAQVYVKSSLFPHSPAPCLRWKARSDAILTVLNSFEADFLCLQELDKFDSFYKAKLEACGYSSIYIQRTGQKRDGCGIFYKPSIAELVSKEEIEYNDLVDILDDNENTNVLKAKFSKDKLGEGMQTIWPDDQGDPSDSRVRLKRDCVGILAAFKLKTHFQHLVIVANTHIYWDPEWADVKLAQVEHLLTQLALFREVVSKKYNCTPSVILAGDFNSTPGDKVYQCLTSENVDSEQRKESGHRISLCSLYASIRGEPPFTNCTPDFTGTLDYIFFSNTGELKPVGFLEIPGPSSPGVHGGLPNYFHPSDHLPIGGDFEVFSS